LRPLHTFPPLLLPAGSSASSLFAAIVWCLRSSCWVDSLDIGTGYRCEGFGTRTLWNPAVTRRIWR
jgi:hypothetical protein